MGKIEIISQTLNTKHSSKIAKDFREFIEEQEYDSENICDDLEEDSPPFCDYIIRQNEQTFNDESKRHALISCIRNVVSDESGSDEKECKNQCGHEHADVDLDEEWIFIFTELQKHYSADQSNKYCRVFIAIVKEREFNLEDAKEDLGEFKVIQNDSIIADGMIDAFGYHQKDANCSRLITCLQNAFTDNNDEYVKLHGDDNICVEGDNNETSEWLKKIAAVVKYGGKATDASFAKKYDLLAQALGIFDPRNLYCALRVSIRQRIKYGRSEIIKYMSDRYNEFTVNEMSNIFQLAFCDELIPHRSILQKLQTPSNVFVDIQLIQIWMTAIVMKMKQYTIKYKSCHSVFNLRFEPAKSGKIQKFDVDTLHKQIDFAFKMLEESEKEIMSNECWVFDIDLSQKNARNAIQYFATRSLFDRQMISQQEYESDFKDNQLYHLKHFDHSIAKEFRENVNPKLALTVSFHKFGLNNCVSWLTHENSHIPFFESDIIEIVPRLFKKVECRDDGYIYLYFSLFIVCCGIQNHSEIQPKEWMMIAEKAKIADFNIKRLDRKYSEQEIGSMKFI